MGVDVTFCSSLYAVRCIDKETIPHGLTFAQFSDGHDFGKQSTTSLEQYISDFAKYGSCAVGKIISSAAAGGQPFDHLVYTTGTPWAARVANTNVIRSSLLWCQPASILVIYYYYFSEYQELISSNINNPTFMINLPGLPPLTTADLPSFLLPSSPKEHDFIILQMKDHIDVLEMGSRILVNSFKELEVESIKAIEKLDFLPIGPLIRSDYLDGEDSSDKSMEEEDYIRWLNTKPKSSVVYVSFGTLASFLIDQMEEVAIGLLESGRPFLWVIRDSEQAGRLSKIEELKTHGMIVSWCSQVAVLRHQAIGCFVMHGGWNSTLETLMAGVPIVVFPQWTDQGTNAKMIEDVWKAGVRVRRRERDGVVEGKEIERCLKLVMGDEDLKRNAEKWSKLAKDALSNGGSSTLNLLAFLDEILKFEIRNNNMNENQHNYISQPVCNENMN